MFVDITNVENNRIQSTQKLFQFHQLVQFDSMIIENDINIGLYTLFGVYSFVQMIDHHILIVNYRIFVVESKLISQMV